MADANAEPAQLLVRRLAAAITTQISGASSAVAIMNKFGHNGLVDASGELAAVMHDGSFRVGEGPEADAFRYQQPVTIYAVDDSTASRWPAYAELARRSQCRSVLAFPLNVGTIAMGVLSLYSQIEVRPPAQQMLTIQSQCLGIAGAVVLVMEAGVGRSSTGPGRPMSAPFIRAQVYQAAGMLMAQLDVSVDEAMIRLRAYAFAHDRPVNVVARDVVERRLDLRDPPPFRAS